MGLPAVAYTNQKAMSSYILLRIKPKLPGAKTGSRRFPDATGGMDSGFSSCAAPAFCRGPGISKIGRYMRVLRVTGKLQRSKDEAGRFLEAREDEYQSRESQAASGGRRTVR